MCVRKSLRGARIAREGGNCGVGCFGVELSDHCVLYVYDNVKVLVYFIRHIFIYRKEAYITFIKINVSLFTNTYINILIHIIIM